MRLLTEVRQRLWNSGWLDLIGFSVLGLFPEQIPRERPRDLQADS